MFFSFFLAKRPTYRDKSSKFYFSFLRSRYKKVRLGLKMGFRNKRPTGAFRLYYLKKFFLFFYGYFNNYKFRKLMRFLNNTVISRKYGQFLKILYIVERQLNIFLYRLKFASSITFATQLIKANLICVNGKIISLPTYIVPINSIVEILSIYLYIYYHLIINLMPFFFSPMFIYFLLKTKTLRIKRFYKFFTTKFHIFFTTKFFFHSKFKGFFKLSQKLNTKNLEFNLLAVKLL
jgi:ribosomal protein S4